jgi:hypothetical protein
MQEMLLIMWDNVKPSSYPICFLLHRKFKKGPNLRVGLGVNNSCSTKVLLVRYPKDAARNRLRKRLLAVEMRYLVF